MWKKFVLSQVVLQVTIAWLLMPALLAQHTAAEKQKSAVPDNRSAESLFAQASKFLQTGNYRQARENLQQALSALGPSSAIYCNLGLADENLGNTKVAVSEFQQALKLEPDMPAALINLAGCFQSSGQIDLAVDTYKRYLKAHPKGKDAAFARDTIVALSANRGDAQSDSKAGDYFQSAINNGTYHWDKSSLPIKVYVDEGLAVDNFKKEYRQLAIGSLQQWLSAADANLACKVVSDPIDANLQIYWTSNPRSITTKNESGERGASSIEAKEGNIFHCTVHLLVTPVVAGGIIADSSIRKACLHELGHALGIQGHSSNNRDIMFSTVDSPTVSDTLSERDKRTIYKLYHYFPKR